MAKKKAQFSPHIYQEWGELFKNLSDEHKGQILIGITMYPNYNPEDNPVWAFIKSQIDKEFELFNERCEKNSIISQNYWNRTKTNDTERIPNDTERHPKQEHKQELEHKQEQEVKEKTKKEKRPTLDEVISYCQERNNGVDANKWFDYYTANGWKVGRNPMKDWKATVRTWERNESKPQNKEPVFLIERGKFYIDDDEKYCKGYTDLAGKISIEDREKLWEWFMSKFEGQELKLSFIRSVLMKKQGGM